ncbi:MAG: iron chelate uptake ABC transporter family permease subunit [Planctomycetota bacterium]
MSWNDALSTLQGFGWNYLATLLMAAVVSYLGLFTVLRRIVFTGVALAQVAAAGVGGAFFIADHSATSATLSRFAASYGATLGSFLLTLLAALGVRVRSGRGRVGGDAVVGFLYVLSAAMAVLLVWRSSRGLAELREILAGEVLLTSAGELLLLCGALLTVAAIHLKLRKRFLIVSYDPEFAKTIGLNVARTDLLFLATFATAVAFSLRAGGLLLVFAYLVIPGMVGLTIGRRLRESTFLCLAAALSGSIGGYLFAITENLPVSHSISALLGVLYVVAWIVKSIPFLAHAVRFVLLVGGLASLGIALWLLPGLITNLDGSTPWTHDPHQGHSHAPGEHEASDVERVDVAVGHLRGSGSSAEKIAAAAVMGELGGPDRVAILLLAYDEETPAVREAVVAGTRVFTERHGFARVRALAQGQDPEVAAQASRVLLALGDKLGPGYLIAFLDRDDAPLLLRDTVLTELQTATGETFGYDSFADRSENSASMEKWWAWWEEHRPD